MLYQTSAGIRLTRSRNVLFGLFFFILAYFFRNHYAVLGTVRAVMIMYPVWVLLSDNREAVEGHLRFVSKILSVILFIGIIEFLILTIYPVPSFLIQYGDNPNYIFFNYIFSIQYYEESALLLDLNRFNSVFLEPGYLSAMLIFMLYACRFDFSVRTNRIMLYSIIVSFSLAGYVMLALGFIFHQIENNRHEVRRVLSTVFLLFVFLELSVSYNGGDNIVNKLIVQRLQYDNEKGISGNNRISDVTVTYFEQGLKNGDIIFGLGREEVDRINGGRLSTFDHDSIAGTGAVFYFVVFGIVSAIFFLLFYLMVSRVCPNRGYSGYFVVLIVACFIQSACPESMSWFYPFVLGIKAYDYDY